MLRSSTQGRGARGFAAGALITGALVASPFAVAATGDALGEGVRNGTTTSETEIIGNIDAQTGKGGYVTRQSNVATGAKAGGAAVYGCRTPAGGTAGGSAPCLRGSNLAGGNAFEFASTGGPFAGVITVGNPAAPNAGAAPFVTNATAVATGLNADKVDGKDASELVGATGPAGPAGPQGPAGPTELRIAGASGASVTTCAGPLSGCPDITTRTLGAGSWFVQAKLAVDNDVAAPTVANRCGLVQGTTQVDETRFRLAANPSAGELQTIALAAALTDVADGTVVSLRCTEQAGEGISVEDMKLTAMKVQSVVGP